MSDFFEHTKRGRGRVKHEILRRYLNVWLPIIGQTWPQDLVYIDGFAGSGIYGEANELGSPLIAYKTTVEHSALTKIKGNILLIFIEKNKNYATQLRLRLEHLAQYQPYYVQNKVSFVVYNGTFAETLGFLLGDSKIMSCPIFCFADPFGYSGKILPMETLRKFFVNRRDSSTGFRIPTELFVNIMDGFAIRFTKVQEEAITLLMGKPNWLHLKERGTSTAEERRNNFIDLYIQNLLEGLNDGLPLRFGMKGGYNEHKYHLVYFTFNMKGVIEMVRAMSTPSQNPFNFTFSEYLDNKNDPNLSENNTEEAKIKVVVSRIKEKFKGHIVMGWGIENFIWLIPCNFNYKRGLKLALKDFVREDSRTFNDVKFYFPN